MNPNNPTRPKTSRHLVNGRTIQSVEVSNPIGYILQALRDGDDISLFDVLNAEVQFEILQEGKDK